jgi:hypothetical protein
MKLNVSERFAILNLLPEKANYAGLKALRKAREIVQFTPEDQELYGMKQLEGGRWEWSSEKAQKTVLDAPLEEYVIGILRKKLQEMDKNGELTHQYLALYEKLIINYRSVV